MMPSLKGGGGVEAGGAIGLNGKSDIKHICKHTMSRKNLLSDMYPIL